jgi:hypothetical protein
VSNPLICLASRSPDSTADVVMATNESYKALAISPGHLDPRDVFVVRNGPHLAKFKLVPARSELK